MAHESRKTKIRCSTGTVLQTFDSLKEAAQITGAHANQISTVCHGKGKTAGGFQWQFA